jgi:hypothetical protein
MDGMVTATQVDGKQIAPALLSAGRIDGKAAFAMQAEGGKSLFSSPHVEGSFVVGEGALLGVDVMHMLANSADSGKTGFREMTGTFVRAGELTQLRQIRLDAGILSANGGAELDANQTVRGRFATTYKFDDQRSNGSLSLSGTLQTPKFSR